MADTQNGDTANGDLQNGCLLPLIIATEVAGLCMIHGFGLVSI